MTIVEYRPNGPLLEAFFASDDFVRLLVGPFGSGKTTACTHELFRRVLTQEPHEGVRRSRWVAIRSTFRLLSSTTIPSWRQWYGDRFGTFSWSEPFEHRLRFPLPDGTRVEADVVFLALDGPDAEEKLRGLEITGAWVNEARELGKPVFDFLLGRVGRYPSRRDGGPSWSGVIGDTNSYADDHWLYRIGEEKRPEGWRVFRQPGGVIRTAGGWVPNPEAENLSHLPKGYYERQLSAGQGDDWIRVYLSNEVAFHSDGRPVFPEFHDPVHTAPAPFPPAKGLPLVLGVDCGLTPAAVAGQLTARGQWRVCAELVSDDMGLTKFAEQLAAMLDGWFPGHDVSAVWVDPAASARSQNDERTALSVLRAGLDVPVMAAPTNALAARLEAARRPLTRLVDGSPGFVLSPACKRLRKALAGGYAYRRIKVSGERYEDKPEKNEHSHVADALQYMLAGGGEFRSILQRRLQAPPPVATISSYDELRW